jgi:threonine/homoserine efflux transporter RhtA
MPRPKLNDLAAFVSIGAVGTAVMGILVLGERANAGRIASLILIIAGIVGLKLATPAQPLVRRPVLMHESPIRVRAHQIDI